MTTTSPRPRTPRTPPAPGHRSSTLRQALRFAVVGGGGVVVNMLVAIILNRLNGGTRNSQAILFGLPGTDFNVRFTALVWVASFLVAVVFNFQLNRTWTFGGAARSRWWSEFWRFLLVGSVAAVVGLAMKIALTHPDSPIYLPEPWFNEEVGLSSREYWAQLVAIVCTMPVNFLVNRFWTFGNGDGEGRRLRRR
ncbi:GtrA family protein [Serinibacter arcticus]|nr:GtrA family protein [Serinibacter arcticus]